MRLVNLCSVRYVTPDCVHILHTPHTHATRIHHQYSEPIVLLCSHHELDLTKIGECKLVACCVNTENMRVTTVI